MKKILKLYGPETVTTFKIVLRINNVSFDHFYSSLSFFFFLKLNEHVLTAGQTGLVHILCQYVATSLVLFLGDIRDVFVHVTSFQSRGFLKSQGL